MIAPVADPSDLRDGYALVPAVLTPAEVEGVATALAPLTSEIAHAGRGGVRGVMHRIPALRSLIAHRRLRQIVGKVLGPDAFAVRSIFFDKHRSANWKVIWHQDLTIAVRERRDLMGYGPWSTKEAIPHVQPPTTVLERMLTIRIHLDDCGADNGPVRVIPGSHRFGRLSADAVAAQRAGREEVSCIVDRGGALVMRPLILHCSSAARTPAHRRVLHLEFADAELDGGLQWSERWPLRPEDQS